MFKKNPTERAQNIFVESHFLENKQFYFIFNQKPDMCTEMKLHLTVFVVGINSYQIGFNNLSTNTLRTRKKLY